MRVTMAAITDLLQRAQDLQESAPVLYHSPDQDLPDFGFLPIKVHATPLIDPGMVIVVPASGAPLVIRNLAAPEAA